MPAASPLNPGYFTSTDLREMGFAEVGEEVLVSKGCNIVGQERIRIGQRVRIDFATTISAGQAGVTIGSYVHIGAYCYLAGGAGITFGNFVGLSQRCSIYSTSDDYLGGAFTNPTVPAELTQVKAEPVTAGTHAILGSGCIVLPGCNLAEGVAVGAQSLIAKPTEPWTIYAGVPAKPKKPRKRIDPDQEVARRLMGVNFDQAMR